MNRVLASAAKQKPPQAIVERATPPNTASGSISSSEGKAERSQRIVTLVQACKERLSPAHFTVFKEVVRRLTNRAALSEEVWWNSVLRLLVLASEGSFLGWLLGVLLVSLLSIHFAF